MPWLRQILQVRARRQWLAARAREIYAQAVGDARDPQLYARFAWPDSVSGRFELLALHVLLYSRQLVRLPRDGPALAQALVDTFFADLDRNLREMGVGDLSMGRKMKDLAARWLGRVRELGPALDARDVGQIAALLRRHLGTAGALTDCEGVAQLVLARESELARQFAGGWPAGTTG